MEISNPEAVLAETPPSIRNANMVILLYGLALVINALAYGIRFGLWLGFIQSLGFLLAAFWIGGSLLTKRPRAWWVALVVSWLIALRSIIGLPAWFMMRAEGRILDIQRPIFYAVSLALSALSVILLLRRDSRAYFKRSGGPA